MINQIKFKKFLSNMGLSKEQQKFFLSKDYDVAVDWLTRLIRVLHHEEPSSSITSQEAKKLQITAINCAQVLLYVLRRS